MEKPIKTENKKLEFSAQGGPALGWEFKDLETAQEYLEWKETVPAGVRRQVEAVIKNNEPLSSQTRLVLSDQFLSILGKFLKQNEEVDLEGIDKRVSNLMTSLERVETKGGYLNVFETLRNPDASWNLKRKIYETQIKPALDWLIEKDLEKIAKDEMEKDNLEGAQEENENAKHEDNELSSEQDEAISSMEAGAREKKEGEPAKAIFSVAPFFGGYASDKEFDQLGGDFRWHKREKEELFESEVEQYDLAEARIISGKIIGGKALALPVYDDCTVDPNFIQTNAPEGTAMILQDKRGKFYLKIRIQ